MPLERMGDQVRRELARFGPQAGMADLLRAWPEAVGSANATNAWPARFQRDGTLVVHTADSVWAFELTQLEDVIRERLGRLVPGRMRFVPGPLPELAPAEPAPAAEPVTPTVETLAEAERVAAAISDEDLRKLVKKAAAASLARAASGRPF